MQKDKSRFLFLKAPHQMQQELNTLKSIQTEFKECKCRKLQVYSNFCRVADQDYSSGQSRQVYAISELLITMSLIPLTSQICIGLDLKVLCLQTMIRPCLRNNYYNHNLCQSLCLKINPSK